MQKDESQIDFKPMLSVEQDPTGPNRPLWCWHLPNGKREFHGLVKLVPAEVSRKQYKEALVERFHLECKIEDIVISEEVARVPLPLRAAPLRVSSVTTREETLVVIEAPPAPTCVPVLDAPGAVAPKEIAAPGLDNQHPSLPKYLRDVISLYPSPLMEELADVTVELARVDYDDFSFDVAIEKQELFGERLSRHRHAKELTDAMFAEWASTYFEKDQEDSTDGYQLKDDPCMIDALATLMPVVNQKFADLMEKYENEKTELRSQIPYKAKA